MKNTTSSRIFFCTTFIIILFSTISLSQATYFPGYVISLQGDTVNGYIDYRNWKLNPSAVFFKKDLEAVGTLHKPIAIRGFAVSGAEYKSAIVENASELNFTVGGKYNFTLLTKKDTIFLKTLIAGKKSLFHLRDETGMEQFYIQEGADYNLLLYKRYMKKQGVKTGFMENRTFIGQLINYLNDCPGITEKLSRINYTRSDLEDLFLNYYTCTNTILTFHKSPDKIAFEWGGLVGASMTTLKLPSKSFYPQVNLNSSTMFSAGLFFSRIQPFNQQKFSFHSELLYTSFKMNGHFDDHLNPATINLQFSYLRLIGSIRYTYPLKSFRLFAGIGPSVGIPVYIKNELIDESVFHPGSVSELNGIGGAEVGYFLSAGSEFKKFVIEIGYEGITVNTTQRLYLLAGYRFK